MSLFSRLRPCPPADPRASGVTMRNVSVTYRNGHTALRDASFSLPQGSITALLGVNGAGKSTLFKAIMGLERPGDGEVSLLGLPVSVALRNNLVSYVPQSEEVDWNFPVLVEDVVMMGRYGHMGMLRIPTAADKQAVQQALERVDMAALRRRQIGELSGGQKKRVFLARALAQNSRLLLLDEPFTGVDVNTEELIVTLLQHLRDEGRSILVATHNLAMVPGFCDHTLLVNGTVLACGPTAQTFTAARLREAFGGVARHLLAASGIADGDPLAPPLARHG
ncbi:manganese/iron ABC transporter ATP-binding protein [Entomohabitans teleogrylli]|uniref:manganese/iron ABC transporter ATP-binding protein n=1 Tax=Entomohabitans teleogrylli TaxID=1384589 RepID=UPI00073D22CF|nr:manganese/iron ABC transporter ATP-binding protein [Entomohabitans teleogrylli]